MVDVSTVIDIPVQSGTTRYRKLQRLLCDLQNGLNLLAPEQLSKRLTALDDLDAMIGDLDLRTVESLPESDLIVGAMALVSQFEAANEILYRAARYEIAVMGKSPVMNHWLVELSKGRHAKRPHRGLSFDLLDDFVSGVLQLRSPGGMPLLLSPDMASYQPTPVRHILDLVAACNFSSDDVLVDLGSGLGHVPSLVSILTGIRALGIEVQPSYVASAQQCSRSLLLKNVRFICNDARSTDLSSGTVFYLYSPFAGSVLGEVLECLKSESNKRKIRVCTLGPCTNDFAKQFWLESLTLVDPEQITVFQTACR